MRKFLIRTYPTIYQSLESLCPGGERFGCGDGWYSIVEGLSLELKAIATAGGVNRFSVMQVGEDGSWRPQSLVCSLELSHGHGLMNAKSSGSFHSFRRSSKRLSKTE